MSTIHIGTGLQPKLVEQLAALGADRPVAALCDENVQRAHPHWIAPEWRTIPLPGGETCKTFATLERVLRQFAQWRLDRRAVIVAVGGGAVGDLAGLAASLFLRGVDVVQVPTTLLAMLDSSVGGKTAINLPEGKNLVGTFCPPLAILADLAFTQSLPEEHLRSGLGEAIKMGIGFDAELFELLERDAERILDGDVELLTKVVRHCVDRKLETVQADPHESTGQRRRLNLGHTLAHALESLSDYTMLHGHAVAHGLHFALDLAVARGVFDAEDCQRCHALLERYGFAAEPPPPAAALEPLFRSDKKMAAGALHFVLPTAIGACQTLAMDPASAAAGV